MREDATRAACLPVHRSHLRVAAQPGAVPCARRITRQALEGWGLGWLADDAEIVVSELMTNAISAAPSDDVALYLAADPGQADAPGLGRQPGPAGPQQHDEDAVSGRGLEIIGALADCWGTWGPVAGGKVVWAWFDLS